MIKGLEIFSFKAPRLPHLISRFWILTMGCARFCGLSKSTDAVATSVSMEKSFQTKEYVVRIVLAGGREELYPKALPASHLMRKHPGMCLGRPDVFRNPHQALLRSDEKLFLGHKYYLIPEKTAQKLKRRHANKVVSKGTPERVEQDSTNRSEEISNETTLSVKEYYDRPIKSPKKVGKRGGKKKHFIPPIQRVTSTKGSGWEPSMDSVQELSP